MARITTPPAWAALLTTILVAVLAVTSTATATAAEPHQFQVAFSDTGIYPRTSASLSADKTGTALADGDTVTVVCEMEGEQVSNGHTAPSTIWAKLDTGVFIPNAYLYTGTDGRTPGVEECAGEQQETSIPDTPHTDASLATSDIPRSAFSPYHPEVAIDWANSHYNDDPRFGDSNCTWFVSQALWAGGIQPTDTWTPVASPFTFRPPTTASVADHLYGYLLESGQVEMRGISWSDNTAAGADVGDLIFYDLKINDQYDIDHVAIVSGFTDEGYPLVTQQGRKDKGRSWGEKNGRKGWIQDIYYSSGWGEPRAYLIKFKN